MNKSGLLLGLTPVLLLLALIAASCGGGDNAGQVAFGLKSESVSAADHASAMAFAPDGRLFFAEHFSGDIRVVDAKGDLLSDPFARIDVATWLGLDWGLTGL